MNMKTILTAYLFFLWGIVQAQVKVPEKIIGNWVSEQNNHWGYGFFEDFAIYDSDFWEYETIQTKKNQVEIKLKKGTRKENLKLRLPSKAANTLTITRNQEKSGKFRLNRPGFFPYTKADHKPFKNSGFQPDTVTIIGYYRNLDKYKKIAQNERESGPFRVDASNFMVAKEVTYFADFDSLGRFKIKFPALNTQEIYMDWGRLTQQDVVEPGETIFLFADMADYIPEVSIKDRASWIAFLNKPKQILYMGEKARLHNELANYKSSSAYFDREETLKEITSDMDFLIAANTNYQARVKHLENYIINHPILSNRFKDYQFAYEKYQFAFYLMQYRFNKLERSEVQLDKGYMEFVNSTMDFDDEKLFTLVREYSTFIRDYVDYYTMLNTTYRDEKTGQIRSKGFSVNDAEVLSDMKGQESFSKQEKETISKFSDIATNVFPQLNGIKDSARVAEIMKPYQKTVKDFTAIIEKLGIKESLPELRSQLLTKKRMEAEFKQIDSLIQNNTLKELLVARALYQLMDHERIPLSESELAVLNKRVATQPIKDYILGVNKHYVTIGNKEISYLGSFKNTDYLKETRDAELLFKELIAPYKGKVIYIDFWGTWCGPCKQQMPFASAVKKELAGKDVIFMYLANNSPEKSWKNVIKQMDLAGENVVHYRLPEEQQAMIERKFSVNSFPTYLLIGKDGKLVMDNAPAPELKDGLMSAINKLLAE